MAMKEKILIIYQESQYAVIFSNNDISCKKLQLFI